MNTITPEYRELNRKLHEKSTYGRGGAIHLIDVTRVMAIFETEDVLDYGCGKGKLKEALRLPIQEYDPAIAGKDHDPVPADVVTCTDVLEHIEPELLDNVLEHIHSLMKKGGFLTVSNREAKKELPDGRNAHLIVQGYEWWTDRLSKWFDILEGGGLLNDGMWVIVTPKHLEKDHGK